MATQSSGFYSYIEDNGHHDAWKLIVLVCALVVAGFITWLLMPAGQSTTTEVIRAVPIQTGPTDLQRQQLLTMPSGLPLQDPKLTDAQRAKLLKSSDKKAALTSPTMTDAERLQIMSIPSTSK